MRHVMQHIHINEAYEINQTIQKQNLVGRLWVEADYTSLNLYVCNNYEGEGGFLHTIMLNTIISLLYTWVCGDAYMNMD